MVFATRILWKSATSTKEKVASSITQRSEKPTFLIVTAIGNPDKYYGGSRHNTGKLLLQMTKLQFFPHPKVKGIEYAIDLERPNVLFTQSLSFMNVTGTVVQPAWQLFTHLKKHDYNVKYAVVHDELSLPVGKVQMRQGTSSVRGHNGLKSIRDRCKVDFFRIGVGIGRPDSREPSEVADYVLGVMPRREKIVVEDEALPQVMALIDEIANTRYPENIDLVGGGNFAGKKRPIIKNSPSSDLE